VDIRIIRMRKMRKTRPPSLLRIRKNHMP